MSKINFVETKINDLYSKQQNGKGFLVPEDQVHYLLETYVKGFTTYLSKVKNTQQPKALIVQDLKGNMIVGAVVQYNPAADETEDAEGNWNYFWIWNRDDIPETAQIIPFTNEDVGTVVSTTGYTLCRLKFNSTQYYHDLAIDLFAMIKDTLDQNAPVTEGEEYTITHDGYIEASVTVENGEKVFSIMPIGEMKSIIKANDSVIEKTDADGDPLIVAA